MRTQPAGGAARAWMPALMTLALMAGFGSPAEAQRKERGGKEVVDAVCASCHVPGKDNAPKIGDARAWMPRASQGLSALTAHALAGIRAMPAHGGNAGVSDLEIERAITYMVNQSGGRWVEPIGGATPALLRTSQTIVDGKCASCHTTGQDGAPKIGDRPAWVPRLSKGLDKLVASAIHGHGPMPARGGLPDLSDQEIRGAIVYMFNHGLPEPPPLPAPQPKDPFHRVSAGTDVYLGLMSADSLRRSGALDPRTAIPPGKGQYHLNISLADQKSQVPVTDAEVTVKVSDGLSTQTKVLDLVAAHQSVSYGSFFRLDSGNTYQIVAAVKRPGMSTPVEARFDFKAP